MYKRQPKEVLEQWNILVGRQHLQNIGLRTDDGWDISGAVSYTHLDVYKRQGSSQMMGLCQNVPMFSMATRIVTIDRTSVV